MGLGTRIYAMANAIRSLCPKSQVQGFVGVEVGTQESRIDDCWLTGVNGCILNLHVPTTQ